MSIRFLPTIAALFGSRRQPYDFPLVAAGLAPGAAPSVAMMGDRMMRSRYAAALPWLATLLLAGCADPMKFAGPIATMRAGTDQVAVVVGDSMRHVEADPGVQRQFCLVSAAASGVPLQTAAGEAASDAPSGPCAVTWREAADEERVATGAIWTRHDTVLALTGYVQALEGLMQAGDGDPLRAAADDLGLAVGGLGEAAAKLPGNGGLPGSRAAMSGVSSFLAGISADLARLDALRSAVVAAGPVVDRLVILIATDVEVAHAVRTGRAPVEYGQAMTEVYARAVRAETGLAALALPDSVVEFRSSDPAEAVRKLGAAHAALLRAVSDNSTRSFIELTYAVEEFAQAARDVWRVYGAYASAVER
jgi:hypothetical protein